MGKGENVMQGVELKGKGAKSKGQRTKGKGPRKERGCTLFLMRMQPRCQCLPCFLLNAYPLAL